MGTIAKAVAVNASRDPDGAAYISAAHRLTWSEYDQRSDALAGLLGQGLEPGDRVAVLLPDGPAVHTAFLAIEKAGLVIVGVGPRAGEREIEHLVRATGARALVGGPDSAAIAADLGVDHRCFDDEHVVGPAGSGVTDRRPVGADDLWLLNSTSGTTGLPKCVMHHQRRWFAFHALAVEAGALSPDDIFMSVLPAPFGFGIWTAHVTPTLLGAPTVVMPRFDADECLALIEQERVTVLAAVSTQFVMLLEAASAVDRDLSSLRVMFTGGEMVPYQRAAEFEDRTGCAVLQFYGSNETGALSRTTLHDPRARRLRTAGRVIPQMQVRLFADDGADVTDAGGPGVAACKGELTCLGYYADPAANEQLVRPDGWMLTGDLCTIDAEGYLTVAGRASDFIIRGGKNVSAAVVEDEVSTHPDVALAAAVSMPDPVFGERVCAYVELRPGRPALTVDALRDHLDARRVGKELWPERVVIVETLPRASGGKVAKGELRDDIRRRLADEAGR